MANKLLAETLSAALDGAKSARIDVNCGVGHLTIDRLSTGEQVLASGTLEYFEKQGAPTQSANTSNGQNTFAVKAGQGSTRQSWLRLPWAGCGGAYEWQIHLNPTVAADLTAHSDGGNVKLDLAGLAVTHLAVDTGGGNVEVLLPDNADSLSASARTGGGNVTIELGRGATGSNAISAKSGAGSVVVRVPRGIAARIHATSGLGKVVVDPAFGQIDKATYQSPDFENAPNRVEIAVSSGAGNVSVGTK